MKLEVRIPVGQPQFESCSKAWLMKGNQLIKNLFFSLIFILPYNAMPQTPSPGVASSRNQIISPTPAWITYSNADYGFSFQYYSDKAGGEQNEPRGNAYADLELNVPTRVGNDEILFLAFSDSSVKKWNELFYEALNEGGDVGDSEEFAYSLKKFRKYLELPVGSAIEDIPDASIIEIAGLKAICLSAGAKDVYSNKRTENFILLGGTRWLEIVILYNDVIYDEETGEATPRSEEFQKNQKEAQDAILKTLKIYKPNSVASRKSKKIAKDPLAGEKTQAR
jgi:hypothetical protein